MTLLSKFHTNLCLNTTSASSSRVPNQMPTWMSLDRKDASSCPLHMISHATGMWSIECTVIQISQHHRWLHRFYSQKTSLYRTVMTYDRFATRGSRVTFAAPLANISKAQEIFRYLREVFRVHCAASKQYHPRSRIHDNISTCITIQTQPIIKNLER